MRESVQQFLDEWYSSSLFIESKTSGSTGEPKTIQILKSKMILSARRTLDFLHVESGDNAFLCLSPDTIAGKMMLVRSIIGGLNLTIGPLSSSPLTDYEGKIDLIAIVPLQLAAILRDCPDQLAGIKNILVGGGSLSDHLYEQMSYHGIMAYQTYGMTETISNIAMRRIGRGGTKEYFALDGVHFTTDNGHLVIHDQVLGIENLLTTDSVELIDTTHFVWIGRADFVIVSGGKKFNPEKLENVVSDLIARPFIFAGIPDNVLGQRVVLLIEDTIMENRVIDKMADRLEKHAFPKEIIIIKHFCRTASGKIDRIRTINQLQELVTQKIL